MEIQDANVSMDLINRFRERANRSRFVYNKYINHGGKNQWSIICSAMDWISVAITYLEKHPIPENVQNDNIYSVNVFTYISCVDMVLEAVKQLNEVLTGENKKYPFDGVKTIFENNLYCADDNKYFKTIRACFGAHPVNLKDNFSSNEIEQRYASWSGNRFANGGLAVLLYSNEPEKLPLQFDIYFKEIRKFLGRTYGYLEELITMIDEDELEFLDEWRKKLIEKRTDICEQLDILKKENRDRWKGDYYDYVIDQIRLVFETKITDSRNVETVEKCKDFLRPAVTQIYETLQNMGDEEISAWGVVSKATTQSDAAHYGFSKLNDRANGGEELVMGLDCLFRYVEKYVVIQGTETYEEQYVLALSGLLIRYLENSK